MPAGELFSRLVTPGICRSALRRCFVVPRPDEVDFLVRNGYAVRTTREGRAAYLATLRGVGADFTAPEWTDRAALHGWRGATLIVHGRQDPVVPLAHAEAVARGLGRVEARWVDGCGHFPQIEHGTAVNGWLGEFLLAGAAGR